MREVPPTSGHGENVFLTAQLGGTTETQRNYLEHISNDPTTRRRRPTDRAGTKKPTIADRFALGYTYQDVLEADQDDILARLSEYLLPDCNPAFTILLPPLFTVTSVPDLAITILLDWGEPWKWLRQLRDWICALRLAVDSVDEEVRDAMDENIEQWKQRRKGPKYESSVSQDQAASLPYRLGPGEWDEPLGVPICVVCQNAEKIEILEREHGWKDYEFDTVLIYLRTTLLKHGGSLIYTASAAPGSSQQLMRSMLDIKSLLRRDPLKHNVNDRDKILVPPNWDSWGKIRPLREDVDFEAISSGWSLDIQTAVQLDDGSIEEATLPKGSAIALYESLIPDPNADSSSPSEPLTAAEGLEVTCQSNQAFFAEQFKILEIYKAEDAAEAKRKQESRSRTSIGGAQGAGSMRDGDPGKVAEHIGPVQFNVGGIQVDADRAVQQIKDRENARRQESGASPFKATSPVDEDGEKMPEDLHSYFASLKSRGGGSATNSPRSERK